RCPATNGGVVWKDGTTTVASVHGSVTIRSDGFVSAALDTFTAAIGSFSFTVPSLSLLIDVGGLNARLSLGAGSVTIPGFPTLDTPALTIGTTSTFSKTLIDNS